MKQISLTIQCEYSESGPSLEDLIQISFGTFLKKELLSLAICRGV